MIDLNVYEELLRVILKALTHERFVITPEYKGARRINFTVDVPPYDLSICFGKGGRVIKSIQLIFATIAKKNGFDNMFICLDGIKPNDQKLYDAKYGWDEKIVLDLISKVIELAGFQIFHLHVAKKDSVDVIELGTDANKELIDALHIVTEVMGRAYGQKIGIVEA